MKNVDTATQIKIYGHDYLFEIPPAGHLTAGLWYMLGSAVGVVGAAWWAWSMSVSGQPLFLDNPAILAILILSLIVGISGFYRSFRDVRAMKAEEVDIDWLVRTRNQFVEGVFCPSALRERALDEAEEAHAADPGVDLVSLLRSKLVESEITDDAGDEVRGDEDEDDEEEEGEDAVDEDSLPRAVVEATSDSEVNVETLIDDRVRRALGFGGVDVGVSPEQLRILAEKRTQPWGAFARWAGSTLLLMAVLGTFAGIRVALPDLIDAASVTGDPTALGNPLAAVAEAFGANAVALVGSIALGLLSHGIAQGRRQTLERLEIVSHEYVYPQAVQSGDGSDPIRTAIQELAKSSRKIGNMSEAMKGMSNSLSELGDAMQDSLSALGSQIADMSSEHQADLERRTQDALDKMQAHIASLAGAVAGNANSYSGLIDAVEDRRRDSVSAIENMEKANQSLSVGMQRFGDSFTLVSESADRFKRASDSLASMKTALDERFDRVRESVDNIVAGADNFNTTMRDTLEKIADERRIDQRLFAGQLKDSNDVLYGYLESIKMLLENSANRPVITHLSDHDRGLLKNLSTRPQASRRPSDSAMSATRAKSSWWSRLWPFGK